MKNTQKHIRQVITYDDDGVLEVDLRACLTCGAIVHPDLAELHEMWHIGTSNTGPSLMRLSVAP
jgi:hypothetical protein